MRTVHRLMRRIFSVGTLAILISAGSVPVAHGQPAGIEPQAEKLLRRMGDFLAGRRQFALTSENSIEVVLASGQKVQFNAPATLALSRPNKMRAHRKGDIVNQEFYYDGKTLTLFNPKENLYATVAAPATLEEMLDYAREKLDVIAPAAEFLYKDAAEKMLKEASSGFVIGESVVGGVKCMHLAFRGAEVDWQIWIDNGDKPLPRKFVLTSKQVKGEPQFTAIVRSWDLAPKVTDREFTFTPPKGAKKVEFLSLTSGTAKGNN